MTFKIETASYSFVIAIFYFVEVLLTSYQLLRIVYYKHKFVHYQSAFLGLCWLWSLLRAVYFLLLQPQPYILGIAPNESASARANSIMANVFYWLPFNIQFATFSLLVLYYAEVIYKKNWRRKRRRQFVSIYCIVNIVFLAWVVVYLVLDDVFAFSSHRDAAQVAPLDIVAEVFAGTIFLVLICMLAYYGLRIRMLAKQGKIQVPFQPKVGNSTRRVEFATLVIFVIYATRTVYDYVSISNVTATLVVRAGLEPYPDLVVFLLYCWWEITPTMLIIVLFWNMATGGGGLSSAAVRGELPAHITGGGLGVYEPLLSDAMSTDDRYRSSGSGKRASAAAHGDGGAQRQRQQQQQQPAELLARVYGTRLFQNDSRYESDDESPVGVRATPTRNFAGYSGTDFSPYATTPIQPPAYLLDVNHEQTTGSSSGSGSAGSKSKKTSSRKAILDSSESSSSSSPTSSDDDNDKASQRNRRNIQYHFSSDESYN
jgi:hypothetical protein